MPTEPIVTREIAHLPRRADDAHKGEVGRIVIIGGSDSDVLMAGAPALAANAAFRSGAGLVQLLVPESLRAPCIVMSPACTARTLPTQPHDLLGGVQEFSADVVALGPGLGRSLTSDTIAKFLAAVTIPVVVDADALNRIAETSGPRLPGAAPVIFTPHPGEAERLLTAVGASTAGSRDAATRAQSAISITRAYGCITVLKGRGTVVTNGERIYVNETGNAGMATAGTGDVLTGIIAALLGQRMDPFDAAVLGVYLHGLAGDFAAEELGRCSMTASDVIAYLPIAFTEHDNAAEG